MSNNLPIRYAHEVKYYVPVYQVNRTFTYSLGEASQDEQLVRSFNPDYIFELSGYYDVTTDPKKYDNDDTRKT